MIRGFTFERALSWPFNAPHFNTFPWLFGFAYAAIWMLMTAVVGWFAADDFMSGINTLEAVDQTEDPEAALSAVFGFYAGILPWMALTGLAGWMIWAMFETASQRRYVFGEAFSLRFGMDELRMMVIGLLWAVMGMVIFVVPVFAIMGSVLFAAFTDPDSLATEAASQRVLMQMFGMMAMMLLLFPLYVFVATRLAPCFALTVKEGRLRFFDAWNVSRGRFWPILGAFVIISIIGSIAAQIVAGIAQLMIMPAFLNFVNLAERGGDVRELIFSPSFLVPVSVYLFIVLFLQGVMQHAVGGPAAFAVRHDPRGGVEEMEQVESFL